MKLLFKNKTTYSREIYEEFLKFHSKKFSFKYNCFSLLVSALMLYFIILHVVYKNYETAFVLCAFLTAFILWRYFQPIEEVRNDYNSKEITNETSFTFSFYDKYFKIYTKGNYSILKYKELYKIYETDKFFYLYTDKMHSLLLDKKGFIKGTSLEFKEFIKNKYPSKYKNNSKKP